MRGVQWIPFLLAVVIPLASKETSAQGDVTKAECIQMNGKGQDLRRYGRLSAARVQLRKCSDPACPAMVRDDCTKRLDEVERIQPSIVFEVKDTAGKDLTAVLVSVDGERLTDSLNGTALAVDPGAHTFTFEIAGQAPVFQQYVLHEGERGRTERVVLGTAAPVNPRSPPEPSTTSAPTANNAVAAPSIPTVDLQASASVGDTQRTVGLVGIGVGAAGLIVGAVFGALSMSAHDSYEQNCGSNIGAPAGMCNQAGVSGQSDAANKGSVSTWFFAGGGALAVTGAVLFFAAPTRTPVHVGAVPNGVLLRGSW